MWPTGCFTVFSTGSPIGIWMNGLLGKINDVQWVNRDNKITLGPYSYLSKWLWWFMFQRNISKTLTISNSNLCIFQQRTFSLFCFPWAHIEPTFFLQITTFKSLKNFRTGLTNFRISRFQTLLQEKSYLRENEKLIYLVAKPLAL